MAREGSFSAAAHSLGYTQSAVSQQIATLEKIVGVRLVERPGGPRRISLTVAGGLLLRHADALVARLAAAMADVEAYSSGEAGELRVGIYQSVGARILPAVMSRFTAAWPRFAVQLVEGVDDADLLAFVERGELDVTFVAFPLADGPFDAVELLNDPFVLLVAADSPLAERGEPVSLRQIAELPLIAYRASRFADLPTMRLRSRGVEPRIVFRSDDNGTIHGLVAAGFGAALIPRLGVDPSHPGTRTLELAVRVPPRLVGLAWHRDRYRLSAQEAFVATTAEVCAELDRR